ncbi:SH3 domain-containing protein [Paenibacillus sp. FSL R10-2782]|uniref:SH3 domain-containing protein n=1 Tax=Paenibacillus sp. FSL R10-2782 TaxID=2954661 RepID=UPI003158839C
MSKKVKMFLAIFSIFAVFGSTAAFAAETKATDELTSPTDLQSQTVTNTANSILVPATEAELQVQFKHDFQGTVIGNGVRLRSTPSKTGAILESMYSGEKVWIDQSYPTNGWYHVTRISTGRTGYVSDDYIQPDFE